MPRRFLFLALTGVLVAILAGLVVSARKQEKARAQTSGKAVEPVRVAPSTPTRVVRPPDLEILSTKLGAAPDSVVVSLRNRGNVTYRNLGIELQFQGRAGQILGRRTVSLAAAVAPATTTTVEQALDDRAPAGTVRLRADLLYADLSPK